MECYHCNAPKVALKCGDCDSKIFRYCSQLCGTEAHDVHSLVCYDRNNPQEVQDHLFDAIDEMQDTEDIEDAMNVASDIALFQMIEGENDHVKSLLEEAHEIIQSHLEDGGPSLIQDRAQMLADRRAKRAANRAARRRRAQERAARKKAKLAQKRTTGVQQKRKSAKRKMDRYVRRQQRRATREQRRQSRDAKKQQKYQQKAEATDEGKEGFREKFHGAMERRHGRAAERDEGKARQELDRLPQGVPAAQGIFEY